MDFEMYLMGKHKNIEINFIRFRQKKIDSRYFKMMKLFLGFVLEVPE